MFERLRKKQTGLVLRVGLAVACLMYGFSIADYRAFRITIFGLALYALPLLLQLSRSSLVRAYALWFGVFMVAQAVMTPFLLGDTANLFHHVPHLARIANPNVVAFAGGTGVQRITTDELGFRVTPRVDYRQPSDLRIFAIGGSTTEEFFIGDEETWTHRVQLALAQEFAGTVEVINTGLSGASTQQHLAMLRYVSSLHPNVVLFLVGANDWNIDVVQEFGSDIVRQRMFFADTPLGRLARAYYYRLFPSTVRPVTETWADVIPQGGALRREPAISWFPNKASNRYLANLERIGGVCRVSRFTCVFVTQPSAYHSNASEALKDRFWMTPGDVPYTLTFESLVHVSETYNNALKTFAIESGFPVCDLASAIEPIIDNFVDEFHFSFKGAARVAEAVTECLRPLVARGASHELSN